MYSDIHRTARRTKINLLINNYFNRKTALNIISSYPHIHFNNKQFISPTESTGRCEYRRLIDECNDVAVKGYIVLSEMYDWRSGNAKAIKYQQVMYDNLTRHLDYPEINQTT